MKRNEQFLSITAANNQKYPGGDESHLKVEEDRTEIKILQELLILESNSASECLKFSKPAHCYSLFPLDGWHQLSLQIY